MVVLGNNIIICLIRNIILHHLRPSIYFCFTTYKHFHCAIVVLLIFFILQQSNYMGIFIFVAISYQPYTNINW